MDINCDLGEGEALADTRALLQSVTSANIASGGHAGDVNSIRACLKLCGKLKVHAGVHPGFFDRKNFGREQQPITPAEFELLLVQQIGAFASLAKEEKVPLAHVKLHGALYHAVENDAKLARIFVHHLKTKYPRTRIVALAGGRVVRAAQTAGVKVWGEIYADRRYLPNGQLVPRSDPRAVVSDPAEVRQRMESFRATGSLGTGKPIDAQTVCVHSDSTGALEMARTLRAIFA